MRELSDKQQKQLEEYKERIKRMSKDQLLREFDKKRAYLNPNAAGLEEVSGKIIIKKIKPEYFEDVLSGKKKFELRRDEDKVCEGDILVLKEIKNDLFTGNQVSRIVKYVLRDFEGLEDGYCIIGF